MKTCSLRLKELDVRGVNVEIDVAFGVAITDEEEAEDMAVTVKVVVVFKTREDRLNYTAFSRHVLLFFSQALNRLPNFRRAARHSMLVVRQRLSTPDHGPR